VPPPVVAVAASGGRDSTALLHCTAQAARALGVEVHALHVHHGLQPAADDWLQHVQAQCRRWTRAGAPVHFHATRLIGAPQPGESVESWARRARYEALADMARAAGCSLVLLAHHRRDQAETLLLQALRGGGPAGLSAMPDTAFRRGINWQRPWLAHPREAVEAYVRRHRLSFVDDGSNADTRYARNRLRSTVWPALTEAFPDAELSLANAARRAQEAAACLTELAALDLSTTTEPGALLSLPWQALSPARRTNAIRAWLAQQTARPVPETLVQRLAQELPVAVAARWPAPGGELRLHAGRLQFAPMAVAASGDGSVLRLCLTGAGRYELPGWGGALRVDAVDQGGVGAVDLVDVLVKAREGGESFQLEPGGMARSLKKQYQARRVAAWQRQGPLLFSRGKLLFVPGLGIDARCQLAAGQPQWRITWQPADDAGSRV
jgi:tRNA(Ile)-lysidine synthase